MPDLGLGYELEDPLGHPQPRAKHRHDSHDIGQNASGRGAERSGDPPVPGRQVGRCLDGDQGCQSPDEVTKLGGARSAVADRRNLVVHNGMR